MMEESHGAWPAYIDIVHTTEERSVSIQADHNTEDGVFFSRAEVRELRDALTRWLDDGGK